jgi:hypothetical protein
MYSTSTEVVLLLKLGGNEVFFRHKSTEKFMGFAQPTLRRIVLPQRRPTIPNRRVVACRDHTTIRDRPNWSPHGLVAARIRSVAARDDPTADCFTTKATDDYQS